jgi:hypothetical protein
VHALRSSDDASGGDRARAGDLAWHIPETEVDRKDKSTQHGEEGDTMKIGDKVLCDGELCTITELVDRYAHARGALVGGAHYEGAAKSHYGLADDLIYCEVLGAWYLWGRCLAQEQIKIVTELRDRGLAVSRSTRNPGSAPAAGEHHQLYLALFNGFSWAQALQSISSGKGVPSDAQARLNDLAERFKHKLAHGYADRDANDSQDEVT